MKRKGFTLVETLSVIAITTILAVILIPVIDAMLSTSRQSKCASNMRQIYFGMQSYAQDQDGLIIPASGGGPNSPLGYYVFTHKLREYLEIPTTASLHGSRPQGVYACPESDLGISGGASSDYAYNAHINELAVDNVGKLLPDLVTLPMLGDPANTMFLVDGINTENPEYCSRTAYAKFSDPTYCIDFRHKNKANIVFFDGHVDAWGKEQFPTGNTARSKAPWAVNPTE